jgi:hypothetical protein
MLDTTVLVPTQNVRIGFDLHRSHLVRGNHNWAIPLSGVMV